MKNLTRVISEGNFDLSKDDQKIIFAMVQYFYDDTNARKALIKASNENQDFDIPMTDKELSNFLVSWDDDIHDQFIL